MTHDRVEALLLGGAAVPTRDDPDLGRLLRAIAPERPADGQGDGGGKDRGPSPEDIARLDAAMLSCNERQGQGGGLPEDQLLDALAQLSPEGRERLREAGWVRRDEMQAASGRPPT